MQLGFSDIVVDNFRLQRSDKLTRLCLEKLSRWLTAQSAMEDLFFFPSSNLSLMDRLEFAGLGLYL